MNKKWLWYVCAVLLCCGSLAFVSIAKQTSKNNNQALLNSLAKQKADLIAKGQGDEFVAKMQKLSSPASTEPKVAPRADVNFSNHTDTPVNRTAPATVADASSDNKATYEQLRQRLDQALPLTPEEKDMLTELSLQFQPRTQENSVDEVGGPDGFGYRYVDNQAPDTATFAWEESDGTWTTITAFNAGAFTEDDAAAQITWGSAFNFYGTNYTSAYVSTNGLINFPAANTEYTNICAWTGFGPTAAIFPLWDDNHVGRGGPGVSDSGRVVWKDFGDRVVVTWDSIGTCCTLNESLREFQATLYPASGKIKLQYRTISGLDPSAAIGIQAGNGAASNRVSYRCNTATDPNQNLLDGRAVWFYIDTPPVGRCCYIDATPCVYDCQDNMTAVDCANLGGIWSLGLDCTTPCPTLLAGDNVDCAIEVTSLPYSADGNTCAATDDYEESCFFGLSTSPDVVHSYTPAANTTVDLSLCLGTTNYDTKMYVYENVVTPGASYACNDDACTAPLFASAYVSTILGLDLTGGNTYYIVVDGYGGACGDYTLSIVEATPCIITCGPFDIIEAAESDSCGRENFDPNGGCNNAAPGIPTYNQVVCNDTVCGVAFTYDSCGNPNLQYRDTDWYEITLAQASDLTITGSAEFPNLIFFLFGDDCATFYGNTSGTALPCQEISLSVLCLNPGTYYAAIMINDFGSVGEAPFAEQLKYRAWFDCTPCVPPTGRCCYDGGASCTDTDEFNCLTNLGGTWDEFLTCALDPCPVAPPNDECETAATITVVPNGASTPESVVNEAANGTCDVTCGNSSTGPDQFFTFTLTSCRLIAITADDGEFTNDCFISVYPAGLCCDPTPLLCNDDWSSFDITGLSWYDPAIDPVSGVGSRVADSLAAGTYIVRAGNYGDGAPTGDYLLTVYDFGPCNNEPCDPIVDLTISVEYAANQPTNYKLWWTAPQTDDYKVWSTTFPNNDGNPDDGADVQWTLEATLPGLAAGPQSWTAAPGFVNYKNFIVTTVCTPFVAPDGRCCYDNNAACQDVTQVECDGLGGVWTAFLNCTEDACPPPQPTGRCCYDGGASCANNFEAECITLGGSWNEFTTCEANSCAAPVNDDCGSAIEVFNGTPQSGDNIDATADGMGDLSCVFEDFFEVWYYYEAATTDPVWVTLCDAGTDFDTSLRIFDGSCAGTEVACDDDDDITPPDLECTVNLVASTLEFTPAAAGTFYIRVAGFNSQQGNFVLTVTQ